MRLHCCDLYPYIITSSETGKMAAKRVVIRPATLEDFDNIINIDSQGKLYDGLDYIPLWLRPLMQDKASNSFVMELDGQIIGFGTFHVVEEGTTLISMSGRVVKHLRYQGITSKLFPQILKEVARRHSKVKYLLFTEVRNDPPSDKEDFIIKENFFSQHSTVADLRKNLGDPQFCDLGKWSNILSPEGAISLLTNDLLRRKFFNQSYINAYSFWWPIKSTKQGMRQLALMHNVAASCSNISVSSPLSPQDVTAISFSALSRGVSKFFIDVYFRGNDLSLLKDHIVTHLRKAVSVLQEGDFGMKLHFPLTMNCHKQELDKFLKTLFHSPIMTTWGRRIYIIGIKSIIPNSHL